MKKENLKTVDKTWGEEIWLVNNDLYGGKLLVLQKGALSSYHCHLKKTETFMALEGYVRLVVEGKEHLLTPFTRPKTIEPGEYHSFKGISESVIIEISTPHDDADVVRERPSHGGKTVVVSGHFDPLTDAHLDYFKQALELDEQLTCIVSSDDQLLKKKGKVNIPQENRREIVELILRGLGSNGEVIINTLDTDTTLIAKALAAIHPGILFRGGDKTLETMPPEELRVCKEYQIEISHAEFRIDTHGRRMICQV
tara:strand:- start:6225 stop:6986 length:762 start_codon:yes stop_codon:yes gene_type:complete